MPENKFVFVVCGTREHIETLHFSLKALRYFSKNEILVVTDSSRNEIPVVWDKMIDIKTPEQFSNHQASIYLKTGLHKFLPLGNTYCYLDTDVVALNEKADSIFQHYVSPITFCSDHCKLELFSPYAVHCNCLKEYESKQPPPEIIKKGQKLQKMLDSYNSPHILRRKQALMKLLEVFKKNQFNSEGLSKEESIELDEIRYQWHQKYEIKGGEAQQGLFELAALFREMRKNPLFFPIYAFKILRQYRKNFADGGWYDSRGNLVFHRNTDIAAYLLTFPGYYVDETTKKVHNRNNKWVYNPQYEFHAFFSKYPKFKWVETERKWYDDEGNMLIESNYISFAEEFARHGFFFKAEEQRWYDAEGNLLLDYPKTTLSCSHLHVLAKEKFNVEITQANWQHWNGGVFLFNDASRDFLELWHNATMKIFEDKKWKTRDQGTLAMLAWKLGLQNHPLLPIEFNFIADYQHPTMIYLGNLLFDIHETKKDIKPIFIHIYHHWGDNEWNVWRDVCSFINSRT